MIEQALKWLQAGQLVAFPTETVYGLGACVFNESAIQKIFQLKKRPADNPLIAHISELSQVEKLACFIPDDFYLLAEHFFPGPLTILLPKKEGLSDLVTAGLPTVGVRMPNHPLALELIQAWGHPLVAPSANLSGRPSATCAEHVIEDFGSSVYVLEGTCGIGLESTVLSLDPIPQILRPGAITADQIKAVLKKSVALADSLMEKPLCPGMKYRHYAPYGDVILVDSTSDCPPSVYQITPTAASLYADLRQADKDQAQVIYIILSQEVKSDAALMNRILKAASKK